MFAGIAVACAQLTDGARAARGIAASLLGVAYLLRAVGDANPGISWLVWVSPLGWAERLRPFAGERWWVVALSAAATAGFSALGWVLAAHRDVGAGLLPARPGRPAATRWLRGPVTLALRLQRGSLLGWLCGFLVAGAVLGAAAHGIGALLNSPQVRADVFRYGGRSGLVNAYFVVLFQESAIVAAAYAVAAALRLHDEETGQRADPVLAAPVEPDPLGGGARAHRRDRARRCCWPRWARPRGWPTARTAAWAPRCCGCSAPRSPRCPPRG